MKKLLFILSLSFSSVLFSQERNGITYQALIVDPSGEFLPGADNNYSPLKNTSVCLQFHIIDSTNSYEYSEQHTVTTDNFGMVNLVIGTGSAIGGVGWENVSWSASAKSLKVDVDKTGSCSSFEELSNQPLTSVPFALYSPGSDTPGPQGDPGEEGMSAYEVWLDLGNTGTEQDFIDSLKGPEGDPGDPGTDGDSAYDVWIEAGNTGTEQEFLDSLKGADGDPGDPGTDGDSAYDLWITEGNTGTLQQFLDSLEAIDGNDGDSAYDIWIAAGNTGTEQEFLDSLKGEKGDPGQDGSGTESVNEICFDSFELSVPNIGFNEGSQDGAFAFSGNSNQTAEQEIQTMNSKKLNFFISFDDNNYTDGNSSIIIEFFDSNSAKIKSTSEVTHYLSSGGVSSTHNFGLEKNFFSDEKVELFPLSNRNTTNNQKNQYYEIEVNSYFKISSIKITYNYQAWAAPTGVPQMTGNLKVYTYLNCESTVNNIAPETLQIGDYWGGGIVYYIAQPGDPIYVEGEVHGLITSKAWETMQEGPITVRRSDYRQWYDSNPESRSNEIGGGYKNTIDQFLLQIGDNVDYNQDSYRYSAISVCYFLEMGGYDDWYLPNTTELQLLKSYQTNLADGQLDTEFPLNPGFATYWVSGSSYSQGSYNVTWALKIDGANIYPTDYPYNSSNMYVKPIRKF